MQIPQFSWDPRKAVANARKHGVTFAEAQTVFADEAALLLEDPDHSAPGDERFILLGLSARLRVLLVVHGYRAADSEIRLISARPATAAERRQYVSRGG